MSEVFGKNLWPGWETVGLIGRGSFGAVYEIRRQVFDETERAALKVISIPQNKSDIDEMYSDGYDEESITSTFKSHLQSIVAEYSLMRKMNGSANIVGCDDVQYYQHDDGIGWDVLIKMELLTPLANAVPAEITEETAVKIAKDMCAALELCRKYGIVHRDIKPQNIFVSEHGDFKLGDFGIAKTVEKTMGGTKIGTYKYMAPEVYNNQPYGVAADIYSLGLVLYWLLNERRLPFMPLPPEKLKPGMEEASRDRRFAGEPIPAPKNGSDNLKAIVLKACAFDPKERYQTAAEMLQALESKAAARKKPDPKPKPKPKPEPKKNIDEVDPLEISAVIITEPDVKEDPNPKHKKTKAKGAAKPKNKKKRAIVWGSIVLAMILMLSFCGKKKPANVTPSPVQTQPQQTQETTNPTTEPAADTQPQQLEWSEWVDELPADVSADQYEIEEMVLYRSKQRETTSSTKTNQMDGWDLFDTVTSGAGYGPWSNWSDQAATESSSRQVEQEVRYSYQNKETTTSANSSMPGWELYDTTYSWGDYGAWSAWSTQEAAASDSREVAKKTQYRYRDITYTEEYSWSDWSGWQDQYVQASDTVQVETQTVWGYYYFYCYNCGAHMHAYGQCYTWAGGCGAGTDAGGWRQLYSTVSWDQAGLRDWHGTGKAYTYLNGELVFKWNDGGSRTEYRYRTRTTQTVKNVGDWSADWSDTKYTASANREVQTRDVYQYRDRQQIPTYHFMRWGDASAWSADQVTATENRKVSEKVFYRFRDKVYETTYYFERWTEWSEYEETVITPSESVEVETKTIYKYKPKA